MDFGGDMVRWLIIGVAGSLLFAGLRSWAPKAAGRRVAERGSLVGPALKPTFEESSLQRSGLELQNLANRQLHDEMLADAVKLKLRARTGDVAARTETLDQAIEKVEDALSARPGSFEGTKLLAELLLDRAVLTEGLEAIALLERSAQMFAAATAVRRGVIDSYLGRGWAYLEMTRRDPDYAGVYAEKAAAALAGGFALAPQNIFVLRGWGMAVDRYARAPGADTGRLVELDADYQAALRSHRDGQHDLFAWYTAARQAVEPVWVEIPPLRDVY